MPEGDTVFRAATTLRKAFEGARVTRFSSTRVRARLEGQKIEEVRAAGKNLLMRFEDGRTLRSHMRMSGSWHLYREGERWFRPAHHAVVELHADNGLVAVCFDAPVVELLLPSELDRQVLQRLGPDATADAFDEEEALRRVQSLRDRPICEVLLIRKIDPFCKVGEIPSDALRQLVAVCHELLVKNRTSGPRVTRTRPGARHWVYGRSGKPCLSCSTTIRMRRAGFGARSTYYCPRCQNPV
jgi:endonuclease-8